MNSLDPRSGDAIPWLSYRSLLLGTLQITLILFTLVQCVIAPDPENLICVGLVAITSSLVFQYLWHSDSMTSSPLSSLGLLGFTCSSQFLALASQSVDLEAFTENLRAPGLTFSVLAVAHLSAVFTHFVYRNFTPLSGASNFIAAKVYGPLRIHRIPMPITLWALGSIGMLGMFAGGGASGDVGGKLMAGLTFLVWLPFMLPLYQDLTGQRYCNMKTQIPLIAAWAALIVLLAVARNHRGVMFIGPLQLTLVFLIYKCQGKQLVRKRLIKRGILAMAFLIACLPVLSDLMLAMQITREQRDKVSATELVKETAETFFDSARLASAKENMRHSLNLNLYDEVYLSNMMLGRLTETKFHDNMLFFGQGFREEDKVGLIEAQWLKVIALLPQNALDALHIDLDKQTLSYSTGDYYLNRTVGAPLGAFVTGSMWADLYVISGPWMPVVVFLVLIPIFITQDSLTRLRCGQFISPIALGTAYTIFQYGIGGDSISKKIAQITRDNLQNVLVYALVLAVVTFILKLFHREALWAPPPEPGLDKDSSLRTN